MAPTIDTTRDFLFNMRLRIYTSEEACKALEILHNLPGGSNVNLTWVNASTGNPVAIGYTK